MLIQFPSSPLPQQSPARVTPMEEAVLAVAHLQGPAAALALHMAYETLRTHRKNIMRKFGAETWTQAALIYQQQMRRAA